MDYTQLQESPLHRHKLRLIVKVILRTDATAELTVHEQGFPTFYLLNLDIHMLNRLAQSISFSLTDLSCDISVLALISLLNM